MRRFLNTFFIALTLVISAAGAAPAALAQALVPDAAPLYSPPGSAPRVAEPTVFDSIGAAAAAASAPKKDVSNQIAVDPVLPDSSIIATVTTFFMSIFAWLLGIAMVTLDNAVYYTVVNMGTYISKLSAIGVVWRIMRDIGNIALIFGFLSIGITTILGVDWYGDRKKMLPMLIVAAVFLNFSLFISEAVIDAGNLFATQFYTQINGGVPAGQKLSLPNSGYSGVITNAQPAMTSIDKETISNKIMSQLKLQNLYSAALSQDKQVFKSNNISLINIMGILLFIVAAFVMFSLAFILIARFIYLIFLIVTAPIGFAGLAVPQLKGLAGQWWDALFAQTITAPVLLLLLYIALAVITDASFMGFGAPPDFTGYLQDTSGKFNLSGLASMLLSFMIAMGLLLAVTISSKRLGAFGGAWATKTAGKLSFGATAWAGRNTFGRGMQRASTAARGRLGGGKFERLVAGTFDRGAKGSFDVRGATIAGGLNKGLGIDAGETQKGGYRGARDESVKAHQAYAKSVGEAIDERSAKEVIGAIKARGAAEKIASEMEETHDAGEGKRLKNEIETQEKKIAALKEEKAKNAESKIDFPGKKERDYKIDQDLEAEGLKLQTFKTKLKTAGEPIEAAKKAVEDAKDSEKRVTDKISREKKAAQVAYAESIENSFLGGLMFGTGGKLAAHNIIKDALKKKDKIKAIKEILEEESKEEKKPKEGESSEKGKPEAEKKPEAGK